MLDLLLPVLVGSVGGDDGQALSVARLRDVGGGKRRGEVLGRREAVGQRRRPMCPDDEMQCTLFSHFAGAYYCALSVHVNVANYGWLGRRLSNGASPSARYGPIWSGRAPRVVRRKSSRGPGVLLGADDSTLAA